MQRKRKKEKKRGNKEMKRKEKAPPSTPHTNICINKMFTLSTKYAFNY